MARSTMERTFTFTKVLVMALLTTGELVELEGEFEGNPTDATVKKHFKSDENVKDVIIKERQKTEKKYELPIKDFLSIAKEV